MLAGCLSLFIFLSITGIIAHYFGNVAAGIFFWVIIVLGFFAAREEKKKQTQQENISQKKNESVLKVQTDLISSKSPSKSKNIIEFTYTNANGETKEREVRVDSVDNTYIEGYCYVAGDTRTFRLDRIDGMIWQNNECFFVDEWLKKQGIRKKEYISSNAKKSSKSGSLEVCFTGFSKIDREYLEKLAELYDFKVRKNVTKNLDFLVMGDNAGPAKIDAAIDVGATLLDEDEFKDMIETGEIPE